MTIHATHDKTVPTITKLSAQGWHDLKESRLDFHMCNSCYDDNQVTIVSAGGYGDILDVSNGVYMVDFAAARQPWITVHHGMMNYTALCIDPALCDDDVFAELLALAEQYSDYPVLDDSDYSEREQKAFEEEFEWQTLRVLDFDTDHPLYAKAGRMAQELWGGYHEPGYISEEHTLDAWQETLAQAAREFQNL